MSNIKKNIPLWISLPSIIPLVVTRRPDNTILKSTTKKVRLYIKVGK